MDAIVASQGVRRASDWQVPVSLGGPQHILDYR
jgi:hypothetical protein